jgi:hypothetical protein
LPQLTAASFNFLKDAPQSIGDRDVLHSHASNFKELNGEDALIIGAAIVQESA